MNFCSVSKLSVIRWYINHCGIYWRVSQYYFRKISWIKVGFSIGTFFWAIGCHSFAVDARTPAVFFSQLVPEQSHWHPCVRSGILILVMMSSSEIQGLLLGQSISTALIFLLNSAFRVQISDPVSEIPMCCSRIHVFPTAMN